MDCILPTFVRAHPCLTLGLFLDPHAHDFPFLRLNHALQGIDIFSKDYIFIPICEKLHWTLAVVCFPGEMPTPLSRTDRQVLECRH
jgi:hypothetical protein